MRHGPATDYSIGQIVAVRGRLPPTRRCPPTRSPPAAAAWTRDISPAYAALQVDRVARARGLSARAGARGWSRTTPTGASLGLPRRAAGQRSRTQHRTRPQYPVDDEQVNAAATARPAERGELRIYLGAAPGVGKTFAMLGEAHRRLERGTDLVAAVVETHGRAKTASCSTASRRSRRVTSSTAAASFPELDVKRCWPAARRWSWSTSSRTPTPRAARNPKRWQDVEELLDAGITVISTVNVQHLESLNDVVAQITGIEQQETVPDEVVRCGRPDRAGRHHPGGVAAQALPRQRLRAGEGRRRIVELLPPGQPHGAAGVGPAVAGRPGGRGAGQVSRREPDHRHLGGARAGGGGRHRRAGVRDAGAPGVPDRVQVERRADGRARPPRGRIDRSLRAADEPGTRAGRQPGRDTAHRGRRRHPGRPAGIRP